MGAAGSVRRTNEIERLRERELNVQEEQEKQRGVEETRTEAQITQLRSEKHDLAEQLRETKALLEVQSDGWRKEQNKTLALAFSDLPLSLLTGTTSDSMSGDASLSKRFPMVTVVQCDVVGFDLLTTRLEPQKVINLVDHLHAIIDEAFTNRDIFIMERTSDGCIAASGLVEVLQSQDVEERPSGTISPLSMTDSSYGSEFDLDWKDPHTFHTTSKKDSPTKPQSVNSAQASKSGQPPSYYAAVIATAALRLMSYSTQVQVPGSSENRQLQLRIALHSGPCSAGVVGLQTSAGTTRIPHYKLFGSTLKYTSNLCATGLSLQIRVSKQCRDLLHRAGGFDFERCPDYLMWSSRKPVESFWLVGKEGLTLKLPSLDKALSLSEYGDTAV